MKPVNPLWFKVLAVGIAVGLGGGYVWKRQKSAAPPPPSVEVKAVEDRGRPREGAEVLLMPGSKSYIFDSSIPQHQQIQLPKTLMPSSKSGAFVVDPPGTTEPTPPTVEQRKLLLSGSKSTILIEPEPEPKPEAQEQKKP